MVLLLFFFFCWVGLQGWFFFLFSCFFFCSFFPLVSLDATLDNSVLPFLTVKKDKWQYQQGYKNVETILQDQTKSPPGFASGGFLGKSRRKTFNDISSLCLQPLAVYGPGSLKQLIYLHIVIIWMDLFLPLIHSVHFWIRINFWHRLYCMTRSLWFINSHDFWQVNCFKCQYCYLLLMFLV